MTPHDVVFTAKLGKELGPAALAVLYAVSAAGGEWVGKDADLAELVGCSLRQLQIVRSALVAADVLTYSFGQRGTPRTYAVKPAPQLVLGRAAAGEQEAPPAAAVSKKRKDQPTDPLFEVIVGFAGEGLRKVSGGRVAKLAHQMHTAGLTADRLAAELPVVVGRYAPHRETLDLNTITACWVWILTPPATVERNGKHPASAFELAAKATANGNPFKPEVTG